MRQRRTTRPRARATSLVLHACPEARLTAVALASAWLLACAPAVAPTPDAGSGRDGGAVDSGASDRSVLDRPPLDAPDAPGADGAPSPDRSTPVDAAGVDAGAARDPVVFVHGYLGHAADWDEMIAALEAAGWASDALFAIQFGDTNDSILDLARLELAPYVQQVLQTTGASRVDLVAHSLGGIVARTYVARYGGDATVRDLVSVCAPQHGNAGACLTSSFGASSRQLCPAYASQAESEDGVQWDLNGDPDSADVDETPFGLEQGGAVGWSAIVYSGDTIVTPPHSGCLDQAARGDCSAGLNTVVDWSGTSHIGIIRDARLYPLVEERLRAHGPGG